jgi:hypothetical protein
MADVDIAHTIVDPNLFGPSFPRQETWETWLAVLKAAFGTPLNRDERRAFESISGGRKSPARRVRELWCLIGRRGGKSRIAAALAVYFAALVDHSGKLASGETGMVMILAATKSQASTVFGYCRGLLESSPMLAALIDTIKADEIVLKTGVVIAVHTASFRTVRGRTLLCCIFDEVAFWRDETGANPDLEVYRAVIPALMTTNGMLIGISSPYRRRGLLHDRHRDFFGKDSDDILVVQGASTTFNSTLDQGFIERAREADPEASRSEFDAQFRTDLTALLEDELIDAAIEHSRPIELPPRSDVSYMAFTDASAGRHDSFCIGIGHREGDRVIADVVRGRKPPFDPASVVVEYAELAKSYGCTTIIGDNYAGDWVSRGFEAVGVEYRRCEHPRSMLYLDGLSTFTRGQIGIPDHAPLIRELRLLERRVAKSGKDSLDHPVGGSDDSANVLFGVIWLLSKRKYEVPVASFGTFEGPYAIWGSWSIGNPGQVHYSNRSAAYWASLGRFNPVDRQYWIDKGSTNPPQQQQRSK